jgi:DNA-binding transcriptional MerR regulator
MPMNEFTVSQIAERIRAPGEALNTVADRLRNWTKEGLLRPIGQKNPGTGRHRRYSESALIDALVLHVLADVVGMPAVKARSFSALFDEVRGELKKKPTRDRFVAIRWVTDAEWEVGTSYSDGLPGLLSGSKYEAHVVINLRKLYERLERTGGDSK